jgi:hypothetical protein
VRSCFLSRRSLQPANASISRAAIAHASRCRMQPPPTPSSLRRRTSTPWTGQRTGSAMSARERRVVTSCVARAEVCRLTSRGMFHECDSRQAARTSRAGARGGAARASART